MHMLKSPTRKSLRKKNKMHTHSHEVECLCLSGELGRGVTVGSQLPVPDALQRPAPGPAPPQASVCSNTKWGEGTALGAGSKAGSAVGRWARHPSRAGRSRDSENLEAARRPRRPAGPAGGHRSWGRAVGRPSLWGRRPLPGRSRTSPFMERKLGQVGRAGPRGGVGTGRALRELRPGPRSTPTRTGAPGLSPRPLRGPGTREAQSHRHVSPARAWERPIVTTRLRGGEACTGPASLALASYDPIRPDPGAELPGMGLSTLTLGPQTVTHLGVRMGPRTL